MVSHDIEVMRHCVKAFFSHLRYHCNNLKEIESRIKSIRESIELKAVNYNGMPVGSSSGDKAGSVLVRLEEAEQEWIYEYNSIQEEYDKMLKFCMPSYPGRYALWLHYVKRLEWVYVGDIIGYSERYTRQIADESIEDIYNYMPEGWRRETIPNAMPH